MFFFGANLETDAFYVAFRIPNLFRRLLAEGTLSTTIVPFFTELHLSNNNNFFKKIRNDIIEAVDASHVGDDFLALYKKCLIVNKNISKDICKNIIGTYKRASNIVDQELKNQKENIKIGRASCRERV